MTNVPRAPALSVGTRVWLFRTGPRRAGTVELGCEGVARSTAVFRLPSSFGERGLFPSRGRLRCGLCLSVCMKSMYVLAWVSCAARPWPRAGSCVFRWLAFVGGDLQSTKGSAGFDREEGVRWVLCLL